MKKPLWKKLLAILGILILALFGGLWGAKAYWDSKYFEGYDATLPLEVERISQDEVEGDWREKITLQTAAGERAPLIFHYPAERPAEGVPCVVLLYGIGQNLKFLDSIARFYVREGFAIAGFEQLGQGERRAKKEETPLEGFLRLRRRSGLTVVETKRVMDYLESRPEVDKSRIYLFGVSMGAMVGTTALAMEPRFCGGILMWGGGDLPRLVSENRNSRIEMKPYQRWLAAQAASFFSPVEPLRRIGTISPRPLLFQNALHDEIVPKVCTEAYFEKARDPKEILWYDCGHENGLSEELIRKIIGDQIEWLKNGAGAVG